MALVPEHRVFPRSLRNGDQMSRQDFHRAYSAMPEGYHAELLGGMVFEPSPVSYEHGKSHGLLVHLFQVYEDETPGVEFADNATVMLSDEDEPQPDVLLRRTIECGGQSKLSPKYIVGAPELVAEVAYSSVAIDLHFKKKRYEQHGVIEYVVVCLEPKKIYWFDLRSSTQIQPDSRGIYRSEIFPGLWIHADALLNRNSRLAASVLNRGLKSAAHKKFVQQLSS